MTYTQITPHERYALSLLRKQGYTQAEMARALGRHRSTISRELRRNVWREDGRTYRPGKAQSYTNQRRRVSRRNAQFSPGDWAAVEAVLREDWSPEQVVGWFARFRILTISHETIYRHVWKDKARGELTRPRSIDCRRLSPTFSSNSSYQMAYPIFSSRNASGFTTLALSSLACEMKAS